MTQFLRKTLAVAVLMALAGGSAVAADNKPAAAAAQPAAAASKPVDNAAIDAKFKGDKKAEYGYALGMDIGKSLHFLKDEIDLNSLFQGLQASIKGEKMLLDDSELVAIRQELGPKAQALGAAQAKEEAEKNQKEGDEFLAKNKARPGVKVTESGLQYEVVKEGSGAHPKPSDTVKVDYTGTRLDGTKFDSSIDRGQPLSLPLNGVIPGWTEGLQLMTPGSEYKFYIPAKLAYGPRAQQGIGPNSTLIFDVKLLAIEPGAQSAAGADKPASVPPKPTDKPAIVPPKGADAKKQDKPAQK